MSNGYSTYLLKNLHTGEFEEAQLHHAISQQQIDDVEQNWKPILQQHLSDLKDKHQHGTVKFDPYALFNEMAVLMIQDADWDWGDKYKELSNTFGYSSCTLTCDAAIQGLGYFDETSGRHKSRIITNKPTGILYIEFIASAPWNRKQIANQLYAGIGEVLITHAIELSFAEGLNGRIGLHSLPQAEHFYQNKCGMQDFGIDPAKKMKYFEMSHEQATEWLAKIQ